MLSPKFLAYSCLNQNNWGRNWHKSSFMEDPLRDIFCLCGNKR
jgi:hypothetical protein